MKVPLSLVLSVLVVPTLVVPSEALRNESGPAVPYVSINDRSVSLQVSLFPDFYKNHSGARDMRWVQQNDSALILFWQESGAHVLRILAELSGIRWVESDFDIHIVRYYPTVGSSQPLIIPTGGIRRGALTEAAPTAAAMKLNLIYQLAHRNLAQATPPLDSLNSVVGSHPLMEPGPYRRDNLAMLLALVTSQQVIGLDSTYEAHESTFWRQRTPGRAILQDYLLGEWILSVEHPLARWIVEEPLTSDLVRITRTPRKPSPTRQTQRRAYVEGLPLKGVLGFSLRRNELNRLVVDKIDVFRLAYACGLREGDVIRAVNGTRVRTHRGLIEKILAGIEDGGATLRIDREGQSETVVIQTLQLPADDEQLYWEYFEDSLLQESFLTDSVYEPGADSSE